MITLSEGKNDCQAEDVRVLLHAPQAQLVPAYQQTILRIVCCPRTAVACSLFHITPTPPVIIKEVEKIKKGWRVLCVLRGKQFFLLFPCFNQTNRQQFPTNHTPRAEV